MQRFGQVGNGEIDWIPDGRCTTLESKNQQESEVEAAVKLLQQQVRVIWPLATPLVLACGPYGHVVGRGATGRSTRFKILSPP